MADAQAGRLLGRSATKADKLSSFLAILGRPQGLKNHVVMLFFPLSFLVPLCRSDTLKTTGYTQFLVLELLREHGK